MTSAMLSLSVSQLLQRLTLRQLRAFLAVAQAKSMSQAAALMHLTPSALSMLIKSLETELGLQLFERTTRRLELTDAAKALQPVVQDLLLKLEVAIDQLRNQSSQRAHQFVVATSPLLATSLLPDLIASFCQIHPQVHIRLMDTDVSSVAALVRSGKADLGICTLDHDLSDLQTLTLMQDSLILACHPSHRLATFKPLSAPVCWEELIGECLIVLSKGSGLRHLVDQTLNKLTLKARKNDLLPDELPDLVYEVTHVATAVALVRAGQGISVLPAYALNRAMEQQKGLIAARQLIKPIVNREIVAVSARGTPLQKDAQQFLNHVKKNISNVV